jgi:tetratricopeptide (TPR) repeat protein
MRGSHTVAGLLALLSLPAVSSAQAPAVDSVRALLRAGNRDQAVAYGRAQIQARPSDAWAHHALAFAALAHEDFDAAVTAAERSVALAPNESRHHELLGNAYFEKAGAAGGLGAMGPAKKGKEEVERAIALDPNNIGARQSLMEFHLQAPGIAGGDKAEAGRQATEIARRDPVRGASAKLRVALQSGDAYDVTYQFEQALRLLTAGRDTTGLLRATLVSATQQVEKDAQKETLTARLYAALPNDPIVRYARARLWVVQGKQLTDAVALLQAYIALPDPPMGGASVGGAHWRLGQAYEKQGQGPEALAEYRRAVELAPQLEDAKKDLQRLERKLARK